MQTSSENWHSKTGTFGPPAGAPAERLLKPIADYIKAKGGRIHTRWGCRCGRAGRPAWLMVCKAPGLSGWLAGWLGAGGEFREGKAPYSTCAVHQLPPNHPTTHAQLNHPPQPHTPLSGRLCMRLVLTASPLPSPASS